MKVTVERLGHLGDGVAAGPIFVPGALPGEVVEGDVAGDRINAPKIVTPSAERVKAPCPHYRSCGGCSLMHASDAFVSKWKSDVVTAALGAQGLTALQRPVATSSPNSRRRATFAARRTKSGTIVGFHGRASGTITEVPECSVLHPDLVRALPSLDRVTMIGASRKGELDLTVTKVRDGLDLAVAGAKPLDAAVLADLAALATAAGIIRITWNGDLALQRVAPTQPFGGVGVVLPPGAFLQATEQGEHALRDGVSEAVGASLRIVDLFAGCGTFALPLSHKAEVHAVEGDAAMIASLQAGVRKATGIKRVTAETRDLFRRPLMPDELARFDAAVIDPPRAGAEAQTKELARSAIDKIAYVSCNPVTFARDARVLTDAGFKIDWLQVVDQFRWSPHVELVASLSR